MISINNDDCYTPILLGYQTTIINGEQKELLVIGNLQKNNQNAEVISDQPESSTSYSKLNDNNKFFKNNQSSAVKTTLLPTFKEINSIVKNDLPSSVIYSGVTIDGKVIINGLQVSNIFTHRSSGDKVHKSETNKEENDNVKLKNIYNKDILVETSPARNVSTIASTFATETIQTTNNIILKSEDLHSKSKDDENFLIFNKKNLKNENFIETTQISIPRIEVVEKSNLIEPPIIKTITTINVQNVKTNVQTSTEEKLKPIHYDSEKIDIVYGEEGAPVYSRQIYLPTADSYYDRLLIEEVILEECEPDEHLSKSSEQISIKDNEDEKIDLKFNENSYKKHLKTEFNAIPQSETISNNIIIHATAVPITKLPLNNNNINIKPINTSELFQLSYEEIVAQKLTDSAVIIGIMDAAEIVTNQAKASNMFACKKIDYNDTLPLTSEKHFLHNQNQKNLIDTTINTTDKKINNNLIKTNDSLFTTNLKDTKTTAIQERIVPIELSQSNCNATFFSQNTTTKETLQNLEPERSVKSVENEAELVKNLNSLMNEYSNFSSPTSETYIRNVEIQQQNFIKDENNKLNDYNELRNKNYSNKSYDARHNFFAQPTNFNKNETDFSSQKDNRHKAVTKLAEIVNIDTNRPQNTNEFFRTNNLNILTPTNNHQHCSTTKKSHSPHSPQQPSSHFSDILTVSTTTSNFFYNNNNNMNKSPTPSFGSLHRQNLLQNQYQASPLSLSPRTLSRINNLNVIMEPKLEKGFIKLLIFVHFFDQFFDILFSSMIFTHIAKKKCLIFFTYF